MSKLLILQGPPASGKTTYARELATKDSSYIIVNRDSLRRMRGKYWLPEQEDLITSWEMDCIALGLHHGYNVIVDATNLNQKTLDRILNLGNVKNGNAEVEYKMFDTSLEECIRRDSLRGEDKVGREVIERFYNKYISKTNTKVTPEIQYQPKIEKIVQNPKLPHAIIVDLDGTIAIHNGRGPFEYDKCDTDLPNKAVIDLVTKYMLDDYVVIFLSGREDSCKLKTAKWLMDNVCPDYIDMEHDELYMRKTGDFRKDTVIKKEIFDRYIKDKYYVEFCLDDRDCVVKLWRDMGLTCLQVSEGNF